MKKNAPVIRILLAVCAVVCAAAFIMQTLRIYWAGGDPVYSVEIISERFSEIAWAPIALIVMIVVGAFLPYPDQDTRVPDEYRMEAMLHRVDVNDSSISDRLKRLRYVRIIGILLAVVCCLAILLIGYSPDLLVSMDLEYAVGQALPLLMIPVVILFAGELILSFSGLKITKSITQAAAGLNKVPKSHNKAVSARKSATVRIVLYAAAVLLIIVGIGNGGMNDVWVKAVNICTECIGLG